MNFRQQLRSARAWWAGLGLALCCLMIGSLAPSGAVFAVDPCTGSATCLNVSIANSISLDLKPVSSSGTFASSSTTDNTISVTTNYFSGYKLSIAASTANDNALKYEENNVVLATIPSHNIAAGISANNYADDTYASTNHLNNTWGYRPSKLNSTDNTNYLPGPTSTTDITLDSTTTANPETANNYNIAIGARVDMTTPKGLYANTFVIKVVANPIPYTIAYNKNTEDTVTNMPANVNTTTMDTSVTVGNAPSRSGYNFVGWCTGIVADGNTCDNPYTPYAAGGSYTIDQVNGGNNLTLYAVWRKTTLYETVAAMSKGKQTNDTNATTGIQAAIVAPTEAAPISSNSGVYEYNATAFGVDSDANNSNNGKDIIYYYRGILDRYGHTGTYGSDGLADAYPNYVILDANGTKDTSDTCWRIVRTTGSGGVKMIYNGKWTGSTCANATTNANAVSSVYFNRGTTSSNNNYETKGRVAYVGYNYNSDYGYGGSEANKSGSIANSTLFSNANANSEVTPSNARTRLEGWYNSNITAYTSILETSAGYCNDRTTYTGTATNTLSTFTVPYKTSSATVNFGAYIRNMTTNDHPTLGCPNTTGQDLLTTSNGLDVPAALLTADEASFAGSGNSASNGSPYHANSFLRSGDGFWLLSPRNRYSNGDAYEFFLNSNGSLNYTYVNNTYGVRPAISLKPGTTAASGTGIATDPWVVTVP